LQIGLNKLLKTVCHPDMHACLYCNYFISHAEKLSFTFGHLVIPVLLDWVRVCILGAFSSKYPPNTTYRMCQGDQWNQAFANSGLSKLLVLFWCLPGLSSSVWWFWILSQYCSTFLSANGSYLRYAKYQDSIKWKMTNLGVKLAD
jgi:hypothetical protein